MPEKRIKARKFANVGNVRCFVVPDTVEVIEKEAFYCCHSLKKIYIPKSVKVIERDAFAGCTAEIYCEDEPCEGWVEGVGIEHVSYDVVTEEDYAFNFHRGPVSSTRIERDEEVYRSWNPDKLPVYTHVGRKITEEWD